MVTRNDAWTDNPRDDNSTARGEGQADRDPDRVRHPGTSAGHGKAAATAQRYPSADRADLGT